MTECSPVTFMTLPTDNPELRCSTVGTPFDHVEVLKCFLLFYIVYKLKCFASLFQVKIVNPETNEIVPVNTPGEICTRGYNTMIGYWNQPDKTKEIISKDGWIKSG